MTQRFYPNTTLQIVKSKEANVWRLFIQFEKLFFQTKVFFLLIDKDYNVNLIAKRLTAPYLSSNQ